MARLTRTPDGRYMATGRHNHDSEEEYIGKLRVENECKRRAMTEMSAPKLIFEAVRAL